MFLENLTLLQGHRLSKKVWEKEKKDKDKEEPVSFMFKRMEDMYGPDIKCFIH